MKCAGMVPNCKSENISYIDVKGFVYCSTCGPLRKRHLSTKKLTKDQLNKLINNSAIRFEED